MGYLTGKTAIITGAGRAVLSNGACGSIGYGIATAYAKEGANLVITGRNLKKLEEAKEELERLYNTNVLILQADVNAGADNEAVVKNVVEKAIAEFGRIDVLINNAGMQFNESIESCTLENWKKSETILLDAPYELSRQVIPYMKQANSGKIIMISSICSHREGGGNFGYGVMKAGITSMASCMANSLAGYNINLNAIAPGIIRTDLTAACFEENRYNNLIKKYPARRLGEPDEIASAALFLASEMSSFVNGHLLVVDGGFSGN